MKTSTPGKVGFSKKRLKRINPVMQRHIDDGRTAGIITLVARRGKVVHFETFGQRDLETNRPMTPDTIFRIYSMTKPLTSIAVMMLYEAGHFHLSDPINAFIPPLKDVQVFSGYDGAGIRLEKLARPITIHDLLTHTSGLSYGLFDDSPIEEMYRQAKVLNAEINLTEMIERLATLPLLHQPGTTWRYSIATDVLGRLVEVVSGLRFDQFLQQNILEPLGMVDTAFYVPEGKTERFAALYATTASGGFQLSPPLSLGHYHPSQKFFSGGGGLVSTAADYLRFCQLLLNRGELDGVRLVSRKTLELMATNHIPPAMLPLYVGANPLPGFGFGLGFRVLIDVAPSQTLGSVGEYGWGGAASTYFWIDPQEDLLGIFLTQLMPSNNHPLSRSFRVLTYQAIVD